MAATCVSITKAFEGNGYCKSNMGGVKNLWIADYDGTDGGITVTAGAVTAMTGTYYQFPLPIDLGDVVEDVTADPKLGTAFVTQTINGTLLGLSAVASVQLTDMFRGKQRILAELYDGQFMLLGEKNGVDITGGGSRTGAEAASLQGYELTFTGKEVAYGPFLPAANADTATTPGELVWKA